MRPRWLSLAALMLLAPGAPAGAMGPPSRAVPHGIAGARQTAVIDDRRRIDGNRVNLLVSNLGWLPYDAAGNSGLIWPKGTSQTAVFASGLWLGATVGGQLRVTVAEYSSEYGPGPMAGGTFADPTLPQHRVYKMTRWTGNPADSVPLLRSSAELAADPNLDSLAHHAWSEYMAGAAPYGAPTRLYRLPNTATPAPGDSVDITGPAVLGDQMLWAVFNDADPSRHTNDAGLSPPLGVEVQQTLFAFDQPEDLQNTVFLRYRIINKGSNVLDDMYVSLWSDPDLGGFTDDLVGCDTTRALGFCYNANPSDLVYGTPPPAVGYALLQGPIDKASGDTLALTAFSKYIGGSDPSSAGEIYNYMRGLLPDGNPVIDPVTGQVTRYFVPGDPVTGTGWVDRVPADRRMMLSSGPFRMAPGDTQEVVAAILLGRGPDNFSSVAVVRCLADAARALYRRGFAPPGPGAATCSTAAGLVGSNCPRDAGFWSTECAFGGALIPVDRLAQVAARVDSLSLLFDWAPGTDLARFCDVLDPPGPLDLRQRAHREYAAFMANYAALDLRLRTTTDEPVYLNPAAAISCDVLGARSIGELAETAVLERSFLNAEYLNDVSDNRRPISGVYWGGASFGGGADVAVKFLGSSLNPMAHPDSFTTVELRFDRANTQKAYRYLRLEIEGTGSAPPQGRAYLYGGHHTVPFTCWDVEHNVQLEAGFVERMVTDDAGAPISPALQPATHDSTWAPDDSDLGGREYLFVFRRPYRETPRAELAQDGVIASGTAPVLYALWPRLRALGDTFDDGDAFRFSWGRPPVPSADSLLTDLQGLPLEDPAVQNAYQGLIDCLSAINAGIGIGSVCVGATPAAISLVGIEKDSAGVTLTWFSAATPLTALVERRFEAGPWLALGLRDADPAGLIVFTDPGVVAGGRYDYRLAVDVGGRTQYYGQVQVDVPGRSRFAFLGARPNPATTDLVLAFSLASRAPARLELMDVTGRRVLVRDLVGLGPGEHVVNLGDSRQFRAGIYFVRITQEGRRTAGKAAIVK